MSGHFTDSASHRVRFDSGRHHDLRAALWYDRDDDEVGYLDVADPAAFAHLVYLCAVCCPADGRVLPHCSGDVSRAAVTHRRTYREFEPFKLARKANEIARFSKPMIATPARFMSNPALTR